MKSMPTNAILIFCFLFFTGCSKVQKIDELLTLKRMSDQQAQMAKEVKATDARFEKLLSAAQEGRIGERNTKRSISRLYGEPILSEKRTVEGEALEVWLYRYATQYFGSDKVYFYFDTSGKLKKWEYLQPQEVHNVKIRKETAPQDASP